MPDRLSKGVRRASERLAEKDVLTASRRRCCLCVFLNKCDEVCRGQIAHLNRNPNDSRFENLVFLCLAHHDEYDGRTSQSKGFVTDEVREYRDRLYAKNQFEAHPKSAAILAPLPHALQYAELSERSATLLSKPWRFPLWQVANVPEFFAYKSRNGFDGVCLIERIDLPMAE
jgi:hypothetical protein